MSVNALVLGIESSCDETAAAVLRLTREAGTPDRIALLSSVIAGQDLLHAPYGGVVPEIAARAHAETLGPVITEALATAGVEIAALDAIAATAGPGLIGGVISGLMTAKGLAFALEKPLVAVNHLEGHALSPLLSGECAFPFLLLLVSGGHCQILVVEDLGTYRRLGATIDDSAGEAFDKTAKLLGLGFPGGPAIEALAREGDPDAFAFPRPLPDRPASAFVNDDPGANHQTSLDFSFSGLKTAVRRVVEAQGGLSATTKADIAASFQAAVADILGTRARQAMARMGPLWPEGSRRFVVAGGVAANQALRARLTAEATARGFSLHAPPLQFCTDNAAMIALAGAMHYLAGRVDGLNVAARPRWPLDAEAAAQAPMHGPGRKGAKA